MELHSGMLSTAIHPLASPSVSGVGYLNKTWINKYIAVINNDQTNKLAESNANVATAAVNDVEIFVPTLQTPVTPRCSPKSMQKQIPHQDRKDKNSTKAEKSQLSNKSGLVLKSARARMCQN